MHLSRRKVFRGAVVIGPGSMPPPPALASPASASLASAAPTSAAPTSASPTIAGCATWGARNPRRP